MKNISFTLLLFNLFWFIYGLDYHESLQQVLRNELNPNDGSTGEVCFNVTDDYLVSLGIKKESYVIYTYSSYNYLTKVTELAKEATKKNLHGDLLILYLKFAYAGQRKTTEFNTTSDLVKDLAGMVQSTHQKRSSENIVNILSDSSSSNEIKGVLQLATKVPVQRIKKRWVGVSCDSSNEADRRECQLLLNNVVKKTGRVGRGIYSISYESCFISWSKRCNFIEANLYPAGMKCMRLCKSKWSSGVSCRVGGVDLNGTELVQCLSNRATECNND